VYRKKKPNFGHPLSSSFQHHCSIPRRRSFINLADTGIQVWKRKKKKMKEEYAQLRKAMSVETWRIGKSRQIQ
jgi:hypothetical protein